MSDVENLPETRADHDRDLTAKSIRQEARKKCSNPRSAGHRSGNSTLRIGVRARAIRQVVEGGAVWALIEVTEICLCTDDRTHG
jgi:hypothetical protein